MQRVEKTPPRRLKIRATNIPASEEIYDMYASIFIFFHQKKVEDANRFVVVFHGVGNVSTVVILSKRNCENLFFIHTLISSLMPDGRILCVSHSI